MLLRREQIRWEQIDPRITARVGAYIARTQSTDASANTRQSSRTTREGRTVRCLQNRSAETLGPLWTFLSVLAAVFIVFLYINAFFNLTGPFVTAMLSALPVGVVGIGTMAGVVEGGRGASLPRLRGAVAPLDDQLRQAFLSTASTRAEELYGDIVVLLTASGNTRNTNALEIAPLHRELLKQCNALLTDHFRIELHRQQVIRIIDSGNALAQAEQEERRLRARYENEPDMIAKTSLSESLAICRERAAAISGLTPLLSRLDAHDELICQALSLAQAALARAEVAPVAFKSPDVEGLRNTVRHVLNQTRAVEEAVAELNEQRYI